MCGSRQSWSGEERVAAVEGGDRDEEAIKIDKHDDEVGQADDLLTDGRDRGSPARGDAMKMTTEGQRGSDALDDDASDQETLEAAVWGLWNSHLQDWFNPGTREPYFRTKAAAERLIPLAERQYGLGVWAARPYPQDVALAGSITDPPGGADDDRAAVPERRD